MKTIEINLKIEAVKQAMCKKLASGETTVATLLEVQKELCKANEPENYYQAEAIKQAIDWYNSLEETVN